MGVKLAVLAVALDIFFPKKKLETHLTAQIIGRMERVGRRMHFRLNPFYTQSFRMCTQKCLWSTVQKNDICRHELDVVVARVE